MGIDRLLPPFHCLWSYLEITSSGSGRASTETSLALIDTVPKDFYRV